MNVNKPGGLASATALVLMMSSSCAPVPATPGLRASERGVNLVFSKGYDNLGFRGSAVQVYMTPANGRCGALTTVASLSVTTGGRKVYRAKDDGPIFLYSFTNYMYTESVVPQGDRSLVTYQQQSCTATASFVPQAGHAYEVTQRSSYGQQQCSIEVVDKATGRRSPASRAAPNYPRAPRHRHFCGALICTGAGGAFDVRGLSRRSRWPPASDQTASPPAEQLLDILEL